MPFSLQDLPTEILIEILASAASLSDLLGIASSSRRIYYAIFQAEKAAFVYQVLCNELGPVLGDALALDYVATPLDEPVDEVYLQKAREVISVYDSYLNGLKLPQRRQLSLDYALRLAQSYRLMAYFTNLYATSQQSLLSNTIVPFSPDASAAAPLSRTEYLRTLRAFYRLQITLNVSGEWGVPLLQRRMRYDAEIIHYRLYGL